MLVYNSGIIVRHKPIDVNDRLKICQNCGLVRNNPNYISVGYDNIIRIRNLSGWIDQAELNELEDTVRRLGYDIETDETSIEVWGDDEGEWIYEDDTRYIGFVFLNLHQKELYNATVDELKEELRRRGEDI